MQRRPTKRSLKRKTKKVHTAGSEIEAEVLDFINSDPLVHQMRDTASRFVQLTPRERDFAQRYALEFRTLAEWAALYHVCMSTIRRWLLNENIVALIDEIKFDFRSYVVAKNMLLWKKAGDVYINILGMNPKEDGNGSLVLKAASDVVTFMGMSSRKPDGDDGGGVVERTAKLLPGAEMQMMTEEQRKKLNEQIEEQRSLEESRRLLAAYEKGELKIEK